MVGRVKKDPIAARGRMRSGIAERRRDDIAADNFPLDEFAAGIAARLGQGMGFCVSRLYEDEESYILQELTSNIDSNVCETLRSLSQHDEKIARLVDGDQFRAIYWSVDELDAGDDALKEIRCGFLVPCADNAGRIYVTEYFAKTGLSDMERSLLANDTLLDFMGKLHAANRQPACRAGTLSKKELECLRWAADGKTSSEIAIITGLSEHTVNHYLIFACNKLNAVNRAHAVAKAIRAGII